MMKKLSKAQKWVLVFVSLLTLTGTVSLFFTYKNLGLESKQKVIAITEKEVAKELEELETQLHKDFKEAQEIADDYAKKIGEKPKSAIAIADSLKGLFTTYNFSAIGIHPSAYYSKRLLQYDTIYSLNTNKKLWAPFYKKEQETTIAFPYDYTDPDTSGKNWYSEKLKTGSWTTPYLGDANNTLVVSYRAPILSDTEKDKNEGIVCLDYALEYIQEEVAKLNLFRKGYGIIINEDSLVISHPSSKYLGKKITEVIPEEVFSKINALPEKKFLPIREYKDRIDDRNLYFRYKLHITNTGTVYSAIIILKESETLSAFSTEKINPTQKVKSLRLQILCGFTLIISLLVFWIFLLFDFRRIWFLITLQSVIYIIGSLLIIHVQLKTPLYSFSTTDIEITNTTELDAYLNAIKREKKKASPLHVKTGFFIQNVKFSSANDLNITGYFWQKIDVPTFTSRFKENVLTEVLQPDFPEAESLDLELVSKEDGLIQWYFSAEIRQSFDYSDYPFDEEDIWLRVHPKKAYQDQLLFIPDFDSYPKFVSQNDHYLNLNITEANLKNGLEKDLFIKGWEIVRTSFAIRDRPYATSFGKYNFKNNHTYPELYFNISVKRDFLEVFVVYFIPILVTVFLLFTVLMTYTRNSKENEFYGFSASTVLGFCASLFFVIIVSHMSLRETLQTGSIIYLEYFFFCLYFLITIVSVGAILFSSASASPFFKKNDGEIIKMMYWPLLCFFIFILTTFHFSII
ncbi:cache domain-containing protein [Flavivirga jejuensis]|uniref:Cache domain-containing protein n=1 Tax=Flavivirga jejuensis TaxID=870487 RepID=A0ABT8WP41_9FLAO|nr:cache domain-containing protein [Flavivirga jejuensis]MDO5974930.1 cache domain-containing protein [Flavivirga jejuensis]